MRVVNSVNQKFKDCNSIDASPFTKYVHQLMGVFCAGSNYSSPQMPDWPKQRQILQKRALIATLDSGINVPPGITVAPPLKNFYITILILFYINLGIAVIFNFFLSSKIFKNY
jgi:hypothetical protein